MDMNKEKYVFISYSSKHENEANKVRNMLRDHGIPCWMDLYDKPIGTHYAGALYEAIEQCSCFMLLLTEAAQNSEDIFLEVRAAVSNKKPMVVIKTESFALNLDYKYFAQGRHFVEMDSIEEHSPEMQRVLKGIKNTLEIENEENDGLVNMVTETTDRINALLEESDAPEETETPLFEELAREAWEYKFHELMEAEEEEDLEEETKPNTSEGIWNAIIGGITDVINIMTIGAFLVFLGFTHQVIKNWSPIWILAASFEEFGAGSEEAFRLALRCFTIVHIVVWVIGIIFLVCINRKKKHWFKSGLVVVAMLAMTTVNFSNAAIEGSRDKCTPSVTVFYCDEKTHNEVLNGTIDYITRCEAIALDREDVEEYIDGEFRYNEYLVLTRNNKDEWKRVTTPMNLPKGTFAVYLPENELRGGGVWIEA